jgi:hypothetical protein
VICCIFEELPDRLPDSSVADPDPFDQDPDPVFHFDTDPDPAFQFITDRDPIV